MGTRKLLAETGNNHLGCFIFGTARPQARRYITVLNDDTTGGRFVSTLCPSPVGFAWGQFILQDTLAGNIANVHSGE
jgi:hypothetical protein